MVRERLRPTTQHVVDHACRRDACTAKRADAYPDLQRQPPDRNLPPIGGWATNSGISANRAFWYKCGALRSDFVPPTNHWGLRTMSLTTVKQTYEKLGRSDPLYAVLSNKKLQHNRWDPQKFFETGVKEVHEVLRYLRDVGRKLPFSALDFGCGVGRLSQALAEHFQSVVGVDIAESMVQRAREFNRFGNRVVYLANATDELRMLDDDSFDFVYSNITLQHIPPEHGKNYLREFLRVLCPGGVALFQVPSGRAYQAGSLGNSSTTSAVAISAACGGRSADAPRWKSTTSRGPRSSRSSQPPAAFSSM